MNLHPRNRHLLIEVLEEAKEENKDAGFLLPDDYAPTQQQFVAAKVLRSSPRTKQSEDWVAKEGEVVIVNRSMIEEIDVKGDKFTTILENYVIGVMAD